MVSCVVARSVDNVTSVRWDRIQTNRPNVALPTYTEHLKIREIVPWCFSNLHLAAKPCVQVQ